MPVVTVAHAVELLNAGRLDGRAIAVAGYFSAYYPSCPYPGRYVGPLEGWCSFQAFTDTRAAARLCQPYGSNGTSCHGPRGISLSPFFMSETSGNASSWLTGGPTGDPAALVLVGHAGDARQWQCTAGTQSTCAKAFVVDRVAWAEGHDVPVAAPQTGDQQTGTAIMPRMTLEQVASDIGLGENLLTAAPFRARDIATVDPRWNLGGDDVLWLVRSLGAASSTGEEGRPATVSLVDDATGRILDSHPLKLDAAYQPARLWQMATVHGLECCATNTGVWERVASGDGTVVYAGILSGGTSGGPGYTTFGGSYGSGPLVLPAGTYSITFWLATDDRGVMGEPSGECWGQITLPALGDITLGADFTADHACTVAPVRDIAA